MRPQSAGCGRRSSFRNEASVNSIGRITLSGKITGFTHTFHSSDSWESFIIIHPVQADLDEDGQLATLIGNGSITEVITTGAIVWQHNGVIDGWNRSNDDAFYPADLDGDHRQEPGSATSAEAILTPAARRDADSVTATASEHLPTDHRPRRLGRKRNEAGMR